MKRKSNIFLLFLTVFFLIFSSNVTQAATISLPGPNLLLQENSLPPGNTGPISMMTRQLPKMNF